MNAYEAWKASLISDKRFIDLYQAGRTAPWQWPDPKAGIGRRTGCRHRGTRKWDRRYAHR